MENEILIYMNHFAEVGRSGRWRSLRAKARAEGGNTCIAAKALYRRSTGSTCLLHNVIAGELKCLAEFVKNGAGWINARRGRCR